MQKESIATERVFSLFLATCHINFWVFYTVHWSFWLIQCAEFNVVWVRKSGSGTEGHQGVYFKGSNSCKVAWKDQNKVFCHPVLLNFGPFTVKSGMCGWCMPGSLPRTAQQPSKKTLNPLLCRFLFTVFFDILGRHFDWLTGPSFEFLLASDWLTGYHFEFLEASDWLTGPKLIYLFILINL